MTLQEVYSHWLTRRAPELSKQCLANYRSSWKALTPFHDKELSEITQEDVWAFQKNSTRGLFGTNSVLRYLKTLYKHAEFWGLYDGRHPVRIKFKKEPPRRRRPSKDEGERFWKTLKEFPLPFQVYLKLTVKTACRVSELLTSEWDNLKDNGIWLRKTKTKKDGELIRLNQQLIDLIQTVPRVGKEIFTPHLGNISQMRSNFWYPFIEKANLPGLQLRDTRRWSASTLVESGVEAKRVSLVLRHASVTTTERYLALDDETKAKDLDTLSNLMGES